MVGSTLNHYEILAPLGAGGMGEVYRARDTKLDRDVAIKVLPDDLAADPDRMARFEREAKVLAQLNHANIAGIYGLEESDDVQFIVMECVEGETLQERLAAQGRLQGDGAVVIALQIAEALEAAHSAGIVHRDLKPANVIITREGAAKVLDFGLAKTAEAGAEGSSLMAADMSHSPTMVGATRTGVILGTAAYMSPEQARGNPADKRADVWAFGSVLFEMLAGRRAFDGENVSDVMASILKEDPDWAALPEDTAPGVRRVLLRCLAKDPRDRLHDIADARIELAAMDDDTHGALDETPAQRSGSPAMLWRAGLALVMVWAVVATFVAITQAPSSEPGLFAHFAIEAVDPFAPEPDLSVSPDGSKLVYTGLGPEGRQFWLLSIVEGTQEPIPGTAGATYPFWSPNSEAIGFFQQGKLLRLDLPGTIVELADAPTGRGGSWGSQGLIVYAPDASVIHMIPADRSAPPALVTSHPLPGHEGALGAGNPRGGGDHRFPVFFPDGRRFTFFANGPAGVGQVWIGSIDGDEPTFLRDSLAEAFVVPGFVLYVDRGVLMAQAIDDDTGDALELVGDPVPFASDLAMASPFGNAELSASYNGVLAYRRQPPVPTRLVWFDREGDRLEEIGEPRVHEYVDLSPDGNYVSSHRREPAGDFLYLLHVESERYEQFVPGLRAAWLHDSSGLVFQTDDGIKKQLIGVPDAGEMLITGLRTALTPHASANGQTIAFTAFDTASGHNVWTKGLPDGEPEEIVADVDAQRGPRISPDGEWVAYQSDHSGAIEIYATSLIDGSRRGPLSRGGGYLPRWSADGQELFYLDLRGPLMSVRRQGNDFEAATRLFDTAAHTYAVSGNGDRFLMAVPEGDRPSDQIHVLVNWQQRVGHQ